MEGGLAWQTALRTISCSSNRATTTLAAVNLTRHLQRRLKQLSSAAPTCWQYFRTVWPPVAGLLLCARALATRRQLANGTSKYDVLGPPGTFHPTWVQEGDVLQAPSSLALFSSTATEDANAEVTSSNAVHMSEISIACAKIQSCLLHMADSQGVDHSCVHMHNLPTSKHCTLQPPRPSAVAGVTLNRMHKALTRSSLPRQCARRLGAQHAHLSARLDMS